MGLLIGRDGINRKRLQQSTGATLYLRGRGTEDEAAIRTRTENARKEMAYGEGEGNFDHTVVNDDLETAYAELKAWVCEQYPHLTKA